MTPDRAAARGARCSRRCRARRKAELDRGVSLVGPHRDELRLDLGPMPAKGYASHGESWSFALALRLASYDLLTGDGGEPVLILDDVFAELDTSRRERLAELVAPAEQVLVTAAVPADVPAVLRGVRFDVVRGCRCAVRPDTGPRRGWSPAGRLGRGRPGPGAARRRRRPTPGPRAPGRAGAAPSGTARTSAARRAGRHDALRRARRRPRPADRWPSPCDRLVAEHGWEDDIAVGGVMGRWAEIVGADVAAHCEPEGWSDGVLTVRTDSTAWATQVRLLAPTLLAAAERRARGRAP